MVMKTTVAVGCAVWVLIAGAKFQSVLVVSIHVTYLVPVPVDEQTDSVNLGGGSGTTHSGSGCATGVTTGGKGGV